MDFYYTRLLDRKCFELGGIKMLYSTTFLDRKETPVSPLSGPLSVGFGSPKRVRDEKGKRKLVPGVGPVFPGEGEGRAPYAPYSEMSKRDVTDSP